MKRLCKIIALSMVLFVGCAFTLPAATGTLESHAATKIGLNKTKVSTNVGKTVNLKVKGIKKKVKWSSSNKKIATVSKKGKVTTKKTGKVTITAKVGKKKLKCKITVYPNYKKNIVGSWEGKMYGEYVEWAFEKNGEFSFFDGYSVTNGEYKISGNKLNLSTHETYTIVTLKKNAKLKLKAYGKTYTFDYFCV